MTRIDKERIIDGCYSLAAMVVIFLMGVAVGFTYRGAPTEQPVVININPQPATSSVPQIEVQQPAEQDDTHTRSYMVTPPEEINPVDEEAYNSRTFTFTPVKTKKTEELREQVFEVDENLIPLIWTHDGGSYVDELELYQTVHAVIWNQPNLPHTDEMVDLVYETLMVETNLGQVSYDHAAEMWHNYGIAQIREDTAAYLLGWLQKTRPDAYVAMVQYRDDSRSLAGNLLTNVPFSIAVAAQYYWHRIPDIQANISTPLDRAKVWKSVYNCTGVGTVNIYLNRVKQHYAKMDTSKELLVYVGPKAL